MKKIYLAPEEEQILADIDSWNYVSLKKTNAKEFENMKQQLQTSAISLRQTKKPVTIRLAQSDLEKIKLMAYQEWMPYQTFLSALVHKIAEKKVELSVK